MLHILLMILKIIGIILLVILGLVLLILLIILLVPIRYRGAGSWHEKPAGHVKVTWLLHILSVQALYREELELSVRVFGIRVLKRQPGGTEEETEEPPFDVPEDALADSGDDDLQLSAQEIPSESGEFILREESSGQKGRDAKKRSAEQNPPASVKKETKLKKILDKGREKLLSFWNGIREKLRFVKEKLQDGAALYEKVSGFLSEEANQKTIRLIKRQIVRILRHLCPRGLKGNITFGLEDPYTMGQVVSGAALLYPLFNDRIVFTPVFGEKIIDGELEIKGRIRIGTLLFLAGRMLLDKNFRMILKKILNRGGKKDGR